ncbi:MAG: undecaprenyl-phosphate glucose phosphotransferase [Proteobacteria bacterium]|nr:undecaprenyl-phosphate glucose phosphotransferase [Pseudomonadota bacterium]
MNSRRQNILTLLRMMMDVVMVSFSWVFAYYLRFYAGFEVLKGVPYLDLYLKMIPFISVIWLFVFFVFGHYRRSNRHRSAILEGFDIFQTSVVATLAFIAFTFFYEEYRYSRLTVGIFSMTQVFFLIAGRSIMRKALRLYRKKAAPRRTLIIGGGELLVTALEMSKLGDIASNDIAGVILVGDEAQIAAGRQFCSERKLEVLDQQNDWASFFVTNPMQTVIVALPQKLFGWIDDNLEGIASQVPDVKVLPDLMKFTKLAAGIELISGVPVISIHDSPLAGIQGVVKRVIDIVGAIVAIILFSPVMIIVSVLVKFSSDGPILYTQDRMGIDGKVFRMMKFRSMPVAAEAKTGAVFATAKDNRATPIGKLLRKSSLDELPQFFNVLLGDMSLVGPRPERPVFVNDFRRKIPGYFLRHKVKAGITGWAQVNGWRGDTSIEKRIECDLYYIQNWSFSLDIRIIVLTVFQGFFNKNAY